MRAGDGWRFLAGAVLTLVLISFPGGAATEDGKTGEGEDRPQAPAAAGPACPYTYGPIIADTAVPLEKGKFALQCTSSLSFTGGAFSGNWGRVTARGNFLSFRQGLKFTYGLLKNSEVYVVLPYVQNWAWGVDEPGPRGERSAGFGGVGDIPLVAKYLFLKEKDARPAVSAFVGFTFPAGHHAPLNPGRLGVDQLGGGAYAFSAGLLASKCLKPFLLYGNLWYTMHTTHRSTREHPLLGPVLMKDRKNDALALNLAAEYAFKGTGPWVALLEFYSFWEMGPLFGPRSPHPPAAKLGILPGLEFAPNDKLAFALGVGLDLAGRNATITYTPVLSFFYIF
jgi:hypothetical protein